MKEYLPTLTKRPCWRQNVPNLKEGELVVLQTDELKKGKWPLARIEKALPGDDGVVRVVEVRTRTGTYTRPTSRIFRLEDDDGEVSDVTADVTEGACVKSTVERAVRTDVVSEGADTGSVDQGTVGEGAGQPAGEGDSSGAAAVAPEGTNTGHVEQGTAGAGAGGDSQKSTDRSSVSDRVLRSHRRK